MLITQLKPAEEVLALIDGKTVVICCDGCKEVYFPETEVTSAKNEIAVSGTLLEVITTDYICNPENLELQLQSHMNELQSADCILVYSCGVGVQTVAGMYPGKNVFAACDTYPLPGWQGVTPLEYDCASCGECYLNITGGICPITACSKSLVNGQCGGAKNGKCEVDAEMDCGWERIYRRLEKLGQLDTLSNPAQVRNFASEPLST